MGTIKVIGYGAATTAFVALSGAGVATAAPTAHAISGAGICADGFTTAAPAHHVDCSAPHDGEILDVFDVTGPWPGRQVAQTIANQVCRESFDSVRSLVFHYTPIAIAPPDANEWAHDAKIFCVVLTPGQETIGSATDPIPLVSGSDG